MCQHPFQLNYIAHLEIHTFQIVTSREAQVSHVSVWYGKSRPRVAVEMGVHSGVVPILDVSLEWLHLDEGLPFKLFSQVLVLFNHTGKRIRGVTTDDYPVFGKQPPARTGLALPVSPGAPMS